MERQRLEVAAHPCQRRHQLVRYVGEQKAARAIRGLQLLGALMQIARHLIERARQRGDFVAAFFVRASAQVACADQSSGILQAS